MMTDEMATEACRIMLVVIGGSITLIIASLAISMSVGILKAAWCEMMGRGDDED